ncbi:MAG: ABC transporter permease, partial [Betaproteobacteria bacterium]|nr:ABC transporter permease [Betaproteobacteria bacterium]
MLSAIPLSYSVRNLWVRRTTTLLTALGMSLVVYVFAAVLMLDAGLKKTLVSTGEADNVIVFRQGSVSEVQSSIDRIQANVVVQFPEVANAIEPLASRETVVLVNLKKRDTGAASNLVIRGLDQTGASLRRQVRLIEGRMFQPGSAIILSYGGEPTRVVGV